MITESSNVRVSKLTFFALVLFVSGCGGNAPITSDVYDVSRAVNFQSAGIREYQPVTVRSYRKAAGKKSEFSVRDCVLTGQGYQVKFATPARINVPNYGRSMPRPKVECTFEGETVTSTTGRINETEGEIFGEMIAGTGLFGPQAVFAASIVALGVIAVRPAKDSDEFRIEDVNIVFKDNGIGISTKDS